RLLHLLHIISRFTNGIVTGVGRPESLDGWLGGKLHKIPGSSLLLRRTGGSDPERSAADNHTTSRARRAWDVRCPYLDFPTCLLGAADIATQSSDAVERYR